MRFAVTYVEALKIQSRPPLADMYQLSPFVWRTAERYDILLRAVPHSERPSEKIARVYHGTSTDGIHFTMDDEPAIAPGPDEDDLDGCEDPTLAIVDGTHYVYYTGWNERRKRGELLLAAGRSAAFGKARRSTAIANGLRKPQGSHDRAVRGRHVAADDWRSRDVLQRREPQSRMAHRLGCVDECYTRVMERCADPILAPPAERGPDKDMYCATLRRLQPGR